MASLLTCFASQLICCCSSAACHCFSFKTSTNSSTATRIAYAVLFLCMSTFAWTMQSGWLDDLLGKVPYPYTPPLGRFSGNFGVVRVLFALVLFHLLFSLIMIGVKSSKDVRAGIQNGWWGPKFVFICGLIVASYFIPDNFFHTYSVFAFIGATIFILIQLVLLIDFAAKWSESWVTKYENTGSKKWLTLLFASGVTLAIITITFTGISYYFFCPKGCKLNIFFVTFNLILSLIAYGLCVSPPVQEARPSSGILQAGVISLYATYLLTSALSDETFKEDQINCNPFSESGQTISTVLGTIFTFVALAYSTSRAATNSKVLLTSDKAKEVVSAVDDHDQESKLPLIINEAPTPTAPMISTISSPQTNDNLSNSQAENAPSENLSSSTPPPSSSSTTSIKNHEQELIDMGLSKPKEDRRKQLEAVVESGALPKSALKEFDDNDDDTDDVDEDIETGKFKSMKGFAKDDEKNSCVYSYSYYHVIFAAASLYVTMLINKWSTTGSEGDDLVGVGHDWSTVWVKIISSWIAFALYIWTLLAPVIFPNREWN